MDDLTHAPPAVLTAEGALREVRKRIQQRLHSAARSVEDAGDDPALLDRGLANHGLFQVFANDVAAFHAAHERLRHALHAGGGAPTHIVMASVERPPLFEAAQVPKREGPDKSHVNSLTER